jgi:hypothetical protein
MILFLTKLPFLTLLFIFSTLSATSPAKPILYLSWDEDPTTTMEIFWIVPEQSSNKLFLKTTPSNWEEQLSKKTPLPMGQLELNHVSLKSLTPNTQYQFRLEDETELFSFQTAPDNIESKITFVEGAIYTMMT